MSNPNRRGPNSSNSKARPEKPKRKFYVRSGKVSWLVLATDADVAALRFVQNALKGSLISGRKAVNKKLRLLDVEAMKLLARVRLDARILVSESGFSSSEAGTYATAVVIKRWQGQIAAIENLIRSKE